LIIAIGQNSDNINNRQPPFFHFLHPTPYAPFMFPDVEIVQAALAQLNMYLILLKQERVLLGILLGTLLNRISKPM